MILKKLLVVALSAVLCILEVGCSSKNTSSGEKKDEIVYASTKDIRDINPHLYSGEMAAQNMVFESLVKNTNNGVKPWLAQS